MKFFSKFSKQHKVEQHQSACMFMHVLLMLAIVLVCGAIPELAAEPPVLFMYSVYLISLVFCYISARFCAARNMDYFEQKTKDDIIPLLRWKKADARVVQEAIEKHWGGLFRNQIGIFAFVLLILWLEYYMLLVWAGESDMSINRWAPSSENLYIDEMSPGIFHFFYAVYNLFAVIVVFFLSDNRAAYNVNAENLHADCMKIMKDGDGEPTG